MSRPNTLGVIIARSGSKGLPGKHARPLLGKPVIVYTIEAALAAATLDEVILTSDDSQILDSAKTYDIWTVGRPADLASDTATVDSAVRYGCDRADELYGFHAEVIAILYGNIPIRPSGLIDMAIDRLVQSGADSVQSYSPVGKMHADWMVRLDGDRVIPNSTKAIYQRQDLTPLFIPNGAVLAVTRESLYRPPAHSEDFHAFLGTDRRGIVHNDSHLIVDVDEPKDLCLAEAILRNMQENADASASRQASLV